MSKIDLDRLRLPSIAMHDQPRDTARLGKGSRFLKGPVPLPWLEAAASLPGKSLHVGIALWFASGLTRSGTMPLSTVGAAKFGLDRHSKNRALAWLEKAGLIKVDRKQGRAPVVTILSPPSSSGVPGE